MEALTLQVSNRSAITKLQLVSQAGPDNEIELIAGCKKQKAKYQEMLYKQYYSYGMSISLRYSYSREEAYEIINDSFVKVFEKIKKYDEQYSFKSWFSRIVANTAIDYYRKNKKHHHQQDIETAYGESYSEEIVSGLSAEDIMMLLDKLPAIYRMAFNLYEIEGFTHDEIAEQMDITASTSRSNLTRAKKKLRALYEEHFENKHEKSV